MRRGHRSLDAELRISTFMALQRLKQFEKIEMKDREKEKYRILQSTVKKMSYECRGKRKKMIYLLNYLERIKSLDKLKCESKLSSLKVSRAVYMQTKQSQKHIIKRMLKQMKGAAKDVEDIGTSDAIVIVEELERSIVKNIGEMANQDLSWNCVVRKRIREVDNEIEQQERLLALL